jgi:hypothetical protein
MIKRLTILSSVIALTLVLGGCSRCGWLWDEWSAPSKVCRDTVPK